MCGWLVVWCVCWRPLDGALVGDSACGAGAPACDGRWIEACGVCSMYAAPLRLPFLLGDFSGPGLPFEGPGGCEAGCAVAAVRTRGCGWGSAGRAVLADGWRIRGADTRTGSGTRRVGARAAARLRVARVRGLRLARAVRDRGVLGLEYCGFVGTADVDGSGRKGRVGGRLCGALRLDRLRFGGWGFVWLVGGGVRVLAAGRGFKSATWRAMRARPCAAAVGSWLVVCAASTRPLSDFQFCWAISRGRACLVRGRGDARRDAPWLL